MGLVFKSSIPRNKLLPGRGMKIIFHILVLGIFYNISQCYCLFAQKNNIEFEHISIEQGLSQSTYFSIFQNKYGFIWIGTSDGLNMFDGYTFKVFRNDLLNPNSLSGNTVGLVYEDRSDANILLGVSFTDANTGTVVGGNGIILRTTNGGMNWTLQTGVPV